MNAAAAEALKELFTSEEKHDPRVKAFVSKMKRRQLIRHLDTLIDWRASCTNEIFKLAQDQWELRSERNRIDTAIEIASFELLLLVEAQCSNPVLSAEKQ